MSTSDPLVIAGRSFRSRLITGTGKYDTFETMRDAVAEKGWTLVDANEAEGRIEATAETGWVRFKDDVVIRIQPGRDQTRVDVRSKSRVGRGDMGANARRVRDYLSSLQARLSR